MSAPGGPSRITRLSGRETTLAGALTVRRVLPAAAQRSVGPFIFFDHFGPVTLPPEVDTDVGGHPHIGLATVSYLFAGQITHRDSLGGKQVIEPGAVTWMTAGRGISHSERFEGKFKEQVGALDLIQSWVALPEADG